MPVNPRPFLQDLYVTPLQGFNAPPTPRDDTEENKIGETDSCVTG